MSEERLQKLLARAGVLSRRRVEELIRAGRVTVNGTPAQLGDKADPAKDAVKVDGKRVQLGAPEPRYLLLHKPTAVLSTADDPEGRRTVLDLVPPALRKSLVPVGRLDFHTSGLLLLTNDGELAQRVAHPRYGCSKTYEVKVKGLPPEEKIARLRSGIVLEGRRTAPAEIERRFVPKGRGSAEHSWWTVTLVEGRNRQVREMFQRIGHPVQKLRRVAIGVVRDPHLAPGEFRELTPREVELLRRGARPRKAPPPAHPGRRSGQEAGSGAGTSRGPRKVRGGTARPGKPEARKPAPGKPVTAESAAKPAAGRTGPRKPSARKPSATKPAAKKPAAGTPGPRKPGPRKPSATKPGPRKPSARKPGPARPRGGGPGRRSGR